MEAEGWKVYNPSGGKRVVVTKQLPGNRWLEILARAEVPMESPVFEGHFPGSPLVPGVLLIETMAQASGFMLLSRLEFKKMPFLANVAGAKMRTFVEPGAVLMVKAELEHDGSGFAKTRAQISADGKKICDSNIMFRIMPEL